MIFMGSKGVKFKNQNGDIIFPCPYYPIGSIYMSVNNTNPSTYFGGTWVQLEDVFLLGASNTHQAGETGGEETHVLTKNEMPSHTHNIKRGDNYTSNIMVDSGATNQWGSLITNTNGYTALSRGIAADNTGGGKAHNNMPPYLAVYIWKRTA